MSFFKVQEIRNTKTGNLNKFYSKWKPFIEFVASMQTLPRTQISFFPFFLSIFPDVYICV